MAEDDSEELSNTGNMTDDVYSNEDDEDAEICDEAYEEHDDSNEQLLSCPVDAVEQLEVETEAVSSTPVPLPSK